MKYDFTYCRDYFKKSLPGGDTLRNSSSFSSSGSDEPSHPAARHSSNFSRSCRTGSRSPSGDMRLAEGQEHEKMLHVFKLRWSIEPEQEPEGGVPNGKPRHPCPGSGFDGRNFGVKCSDQDVPRVQRSFWGGLILWRQESILLSSGHRCVSGGRRRFHLRTPKGMQYLRLPTG